MHQRPVIVICDEPSGEEPGSGDEPSGEEPWNGDEPSREDSGARRSAIGVALVALLWTALVIGAQGHVAASGDATRVARARGEAADTAAAAAAQIGHGGTKGPEPAPTWPSGPILLETAAGALVHVYPPTLATAAATAGAAAAPVVAAVALPVVFMLHGTCMDPIATCEAWLDSAPASGPPHDSWLVCPHGNSPCPSSDGVFRRDWNGDEETRGRYLDEARGELERRFGELVAPAGSDVLVGFSRGAFVARDAVYARPARYRGMILVGAALVPDPERLRRAGISRVVMAASKNDSARPTMLAATAKLGAAVTARFADNGPYWHQWPGSFGAVGGDALTWLRETQLPETQLRDTELRDTVSDGG